MKRQFRIFLVVYAVFLLMPHSTSVITPSQAQQGSEVSVPERVELEAKLSAQSGNDIYFQSNVDNAVLDHAFKSTESSYDLYAYDGLEKSEGPLNTYNPLLEDFQAPNVDALYHVSNQSNLDIDLLYTAVYYDLTGGEGNLTGIESTILSEAEMNGFRFNAAAGEPLIIDLKIKGQRDEKLKLDIFLVSPSGVVYDYSAVNDEFETFINEFIPVVPNEDGLHTLYLSPQNDDIILQSLQILTSPPEVEINSGYTARWTGTETSTLFFKYNQSLSDTVTMLDMSAEVFYNDTVGSPDKLLGRINMNFFTPTTTPFGGDLPATIIQWKNNATYVAVTVTPPNERDQFVKAEKDELGLQPGFDVEYAFWAEIFDVEDFTPDEDIIVETSTNPAGNSYYWNLATDTLIGLNSTGAALAGIINLDDQEAPVYVIDSTDFDILNDAGDTPTLLPAGNYFVTFLGAPSPTQARIHTIPMLNLGVGDPATFGLKLGQSLFFQLPTILPAKEYFNFTYMDYLNATIDVDFRLYDGMFVEQDSLPFTFEEYYSTGGAVHEELNNTEFGNTDETSQYNLELGYLRVTMTDNQQFSPLGVSLSTTNSTFQGTLRIERLNYLSSWPASDPLVQVESSLFDGSDSVEINASKTDLVIVYDWTSDDSFAGYRMSFSAENTSYSIYTFVDWNNLWHDGLSPAGATVIDGIDYFNYELEFGTNMDINFGIVVVFNNPALNGTFTLNLEKIVIQGTPGVVLGEVNTVAYDPDFDTPTADGTDSDDDDGIDPLLIGGAVVVIVGVAAVTTVVLRRRSA